MCVEIVFFNGKKNRKILVKLGDSDMQLFLLSKFQDVDDCAKMFICQLGTKPEDNLDDIEQNIKNMFGKGQLISKEDFKVFI